MNDDRLYIDPETLRSAQEAMRMATRWMSQNSGLVESLARLREQMQRQLDEFIQQIDWDALKETASMIERFHGRKRVEDAFTAIDLIPAPSMAQELVDSVVEAHESGKTKAEICELVLAHFDADNATPIASIVDKLVASSEFSARVGVLKDVLVAHRIGLDTITTYPLVAMIEGVLISAFAPHVTKPRTDLRHNKLAEHLREMPATVADQVGFPAVAAMLAFMEGSLYHSSHWWDDEATRSNYLDLNRHRLLHGMAAQGTRINTVRCFLLLDLIREMLPAMRHQWLDHLPSSESGDTNTDVAAAE